MRYSIPVKFIAILLTAVALVAGVGSVIGIVQLVNYNLYTDTIDDYLYQRLEFHAYDLANSLVERYAVTNLSNCSEEALKELGYRHYFEDVLSWSGFNEENFSYTISAMDGVVFQEDQGLLKGEGIVFETVCSVRFPVVVTDEAEIDRLFGKDYSHSEELELKSYAPSTVIRYYTSPKYTVSVTLVQDAAMNRFGTSVPMVELLYSLRYGLIAALALSLAVFAAGAVYLCVVAGKTSRHGSVRPAAINRIPLDLYAGISALVIVSCLNEAIRLIYNWVSSGKDYNAGTLSLSVFLFLAVALLTVGFLYAIATQVKLPHFFWLRHTLLYWLVTGIGKLLPIIWRFLLLGLALIALCVLCAVDTANGHYIPLILALIATVGVLVYYACSYAALYRGAKRISRGNLNAKINTRYLFGSYRQIADYMNNLADVAIEAARKQMQSDRMKTELITNVSHDIKTPLTSIINYVDILQNVRDEDQTAQYLEVLSRQSQRLKKLIEDLMELSKASTGNMPVDLIPLDAAEAITQALGEFSDKLENAGLEVVFTPPAETLTMLADGRMSWRVMSNLFSNVVKYAMPGTRVYLELSRQADWVMISLKNISRAPLNISPDELTERFVRGDTSRKTEGSGLGLNIAKSLMELQNGQLILRVDGDLFKATVLFPLAPENA